MQAVGISYEGIYHQKIQRDQKELITVDVIPSRRIPVLIAIASLRSAMHYFL